MLAEDDRGDRGQQRDLDEFIEVGFPDFAQEPLGLVLEEPVGGEATECGRVEGL
ncbi:hypothetical protein ACIRG5_47725 [Lentzea sp. NPDC102401]|uniref:hypothetical protein n=1 Tax=Lentzea sp. NPDC102401 TaxID=3364128 RepID=UPI0038002515